MLHCVSTHFQVQNTFVVVQGKMFHSVTGLRTVDTRCYVTSHCCLHQMCTEQPFATECFAMIPACSRICWYVVHFSDARSLAVAFLTSWCSLKGRTEWSTNLADTQNGDLKCERGDVGDKSSRDFMDFRPRGPGRVDLVDPVSTCYGGDPRPHSDMSQSRDGESVGMSEECQSCQFSFQEVKRKQPHVLVCGLKRMSELLSRQELHLGALRVAVLEDCADMLSNDGANHL